MENLFFPSWFPVFPIHADSRIYLGYLRDTTLESVSVAPGIMTGPKIGLSGWMHLTLPVQGGWCGFHLSARDAELVQQLQLSPKLAAGDFAAEQLSVAR